MDNGEAKSHAWLVEVTYDDMTYSYTIVHTVPMDEQWANRIAFARLLRDIEHYLKEQCNFQASPLPQLIRAG